MRPSLRPAERASGDWASSLVDGAFVLTARLVEKSSWRISANEVGQETALRRSPTIGGNDVSLVILGRRAHSLTGSLGTVRGPASESGLFTP